jgi:carboxypeptidase family protein
MGACFTLPGAARGSRWLLNGERSLGRSEIETTIALTNTQKSRGRKLVTCERNNRPVQSVSGAAGRFFETVPSHFRRLDANLRTGYLPFTLQSRLRSFLAPRAQGQAISGDLTGTVTDISGAVVPNATVTATNSATDVKSSVRANSAGLYRIPNLLPGNYTVSADSPGSTHFELRGVPIQLNQAATVNITISLAEVLQLRPSG